jgi:hypothetical protein
MKFQSGRRFTPPRDNAARVASVRSSGAVLAKGRTAGYASGDFHASWLFLHASVFPGGIILSLPVMRPRVILRSEMTGITEKRSLFGRRLEVEHTGVGTASLSSLGERHRARLAED